MPRRWAEIGLLVSGLFFMGSAGWRVTERALFQSRPEFAKAFRPGLRVLGRLEIPRLGMAVLVVDGADEKSLSVAAGHVAGTAALGASGNAVLAGHRDAEFRALRGIRVGDRVRIRADWTYVYVVRRIRVVSPRDITPLAQQGAACLTLVTCYPFRYLGDAPERFIVQAELVGT
jgi:sortase A